MVNLRLSGASPSFASWSHQVDAPMVRAVDPALNRQAKPPVSTTTSAEGSADTGVRIFGREPKALEHTRKAVGRHRMS